MNESTNVVSCDVENVNLSIENDKNIILEELNRDIQNISKKLKLFSQISTALDSKSLPNISIVQLESLANAIYKARRNRSKFIRKSLLAEPAWDMLLDLFVSSANKRDVSISSLCIAGDVPATTGLRWIRTLEKEGLVKRVAVASDKRVSHIRLTNAGYEAVRSSLVQSYETFNRQLSGRTGK